VLPRGWCLLPRSSWQTISYPISQLSLAFPLPGWSVAPWLTQAKLYFATESKARLPVGRVKVGTIVVRESWPEMLHDNFVEISTGDDAIT
jgi:hypothetical protein